MRTNKKLSIVCLMIFLLALPLSEIMSSTDTQKVEKKISLPIMAKFSSSLNGGNIGDKIPFLLRIDFVDTFRIDPSSISDINLKPDSIQKELFDIVFASYDPFEIVSKSPVIIKGWMKIYSPGEFVIPSIYINYTCPGCPDNSVKQIKTPGVIVKIASIVPSQFLSGSGNGLIIPVDEIAPVDRTRSIHDKASAHFYMAGIFFLLGMVCAVWGVANFYIDAKKRTASRKKVGIVDSHEQELINYLEQEPCLPHWKYMARAAKFFRVFLVKKYNLSRTWEGGTCQVFFRSVSVQLPEELRAETSFLMKTADETVSLELETCPVINDYKNRMRKIIESIETGKGGD